jgi:peptidoglycan/xylan/chitin deacetylase (PgdA/CDA1 family)
MIATQALLPVAGPALRLFDRVRGPRRPRLSILIYHRVLARPDPFFPDLPDAAAFAQQLRTIARSYRIVPLPAALRSLRDGGTDLPPNAAAITFDDGYADNAEVALPVLQSLGLHASFFVSPGFLNGGRMWNDTVYETLRALPAGTHDLDELGRYVLGDAASRRQASNAVIGRIKHLEQNERQARVDALARRAPALPQDLMMSDDQVRRLHAAGMEIGAHTLTHPILAKLTRSAAQAEIGGSRRRLQELVQAPIDLFAYPNGKPAQDYAREHVDLVREEGFAAALSTAWGVAHAESDFFQLPRFTPWDRDPLRFLLRLTLNRSQLNAERV